METKSLNLYTNKGNTIYSSVLTFNKLDVAMFLQLITSQNLARQVVQLVEFMGT